MMHLLFCNFMARLCFSLLLVCPILTGNFSRRLVSYIDYISSIYDIAVISDFVALLSTVGAANATAQCCCVNDYRSLVRRVFVRNVVVQIPKFDAKPNPNPNQ